MATPIRDTTLYRLSSSPDPLDTSTSAAPLIPVPLSVPRRVMRSNRSQRFTSPAVTSVGRGTSTSPRKQTFELEVGNHRGASQKLFVTVETEEAAATGSGALATAHTATPSRRGRRKLFQPTSPTLAPASASARRRRQRQDVTTTVPLKDGTEEPSATTATPKRRGRPPRAATPGATPVTRRRARGSVRKTPVRSTEDDVEREATYDSVADVAPTPRPRTRATKRKVDEALLEEEEEEGVANTRPATATKRRQYRHPSATPLRSDAGRPEAEQAVEDFAPAPLSDPPEAHSIARTIETSDNEEEEEEDIWMATLSDHDKTPRAAPQLTANPPLQQQSHPHSPPSPSEASFEPDGGGMRSDSDDDNDDNDHLDPLDTDFDPDPHPQTDDMPHSDAFTEDTNAPNPIHDLDTIAQGEDFSMIFMDSLVSMRTAGDANEDDNSMTAAHEEDQHDDYDGGRAGEETEFGEATSLIINNTLLEMRRNIRRGAGIATSSPSVSSKIGSPSFSQTPRRQKRNVPLGRQLLSLKRRTPGGLSQSPAARPESPVPTIPEEEHEDSFSEIPEEYLTHNETNNGGEQDDERGQRTASQETIIEVDDDDHQHQDQQQSSERDDEITIIAPTSPVPASPSPPPPPLPPPPPPAVPAQSSVPPSSPVRQPLTPQDTPSPSPLAHAEPEPPSPVPTEPLSPAEQLVSDAISPKKSSPVQPSMQTIPESEAPPPPPPPATVAQSPAPAVPPITITTSAVLEPAANKTPLDQLPQPSSPRLPPLITNPIHQARANAAAAAASNNAAAVTAATVVPGGHMNLDHGQRPTLSPIVRAGMALQSITSDPPSPAERSGILRSPFRSSMERDLSGGVPSIHSSATAMSRRRQGHARSATAVSIASIASARSRADPAPPTSRPVSADHSRFGSTRGSFINSLRNSTSNDNSYLSRLNYPQPFSRQSVSSAAAAAAAAQPLSSQGAAPNDTTNAEDHGDEMSWLADDGLVRGNPRKERSLLLQQQEGQEQAERSVYNNNSITPHQSSMEAVQGSFPTATQPETNQAVSTATDVDEDVSMRDAEPLQDYDNEEEGGDDEDIWAVEASRPTPRAIRTRAQQEPQAVATQPRRRTLPSPWQRAMDNARINGGRRDPQQDDEVELQLSTPVAMQQQQQPPPPSSAVNKPVSSAARSLFNLSDFFSSPAQLPRLAGGLLGRLTKAAPEKPKPVPTPQPVSDDDDDDNDTEPEVVEEEEPVDEQMDNEPEPEAEAEEETRSKSPDVLRTSSMFPCITQKTNFSPQKRQASTLFSSPARRVGIVPRPAAQPTFTKQISIETNPTTVSAEPFSSPARAAGTSRHTPSTPPAAAATPDPVPPKTSFTPHITPPNASLSRDDINHWRARAGLAPAPLSGYTFSTAPAPGTALERVRRNIADARRQAQLRAAPPPPRAASPTKSCLRSPLKGRTPGRVVEFAREVLSPQEQAAARLARRRLQQQEAEAAYERELEEEERQQQQQQAAYATRTLAVPAPASQPTDTNAKENVNVRSAQLTKTLAIEASLQAAKPAAPASPVSYPDLSHIAPLAPSAKWTRQHWAHLDALLQQRRRAGSTLPSPDDDAARRAAPLLGRTITAPDGARVTLAQWHVDVVAQCARDVAAAGDLAGTLGEVRGLAKRVFALLVGEARRG